jgi:hypothetical protein
MNVSMNEFGNEGMCECERLNKYFGNEEMRQ